MSTFRTRTVWIGMATAAVVAIGYFGVDKETNTPVDDTALISNFCVDCHNEVEVAGGLRLDDKNPSDVAAHADVWERVVRKLKTGMMPPAGGPRPERPTVEAFTASLENRLDASADAAPGRATLHRLNRTEYANAIRDLLALDIDATTLLPLDGSSEGFDNIATALGVSPSLVQAYVSAAMKISRQALGDATTPQSQVSYQAPPSLKQDRHIEGLPLGTRGGFSIDHRFPLDAEYTFRIRRGFRYPPGTRVDVTLDGRPIETETTREFTLPVSAGPHTLTFAMVDTRRAAGVDEIYSGFETPGSIGSVEIDGPLNPTGVGDTPSRRRLLTCYPTDEAEEQTCATEIIGTLATRAFRRPFARESAEPFMAAFNQGREEGGFDVGLQHALARVLVDPRFLYRIEREPADLQDGESFELDEFDLASRLSFFIWSSVPDDTLLEVAARGELRDPEILAAQTRRMLNDARSAALIDNFASQWLFLRELDSVTPDADAFDENLKQSMLEETRRLASAIVNEDLSVLRFLDADFTFLNQRLAEHYGLEGVLGSQFRRVPLETESPRRGLLGHASILTVTSVTSRTSPVIRGSWILENLLGSPPPVPPPNVETTLEGDDGATVATSVRERLEAHRANPACASCHAIMDPIGFSLENFDLIGGWRDTDNGRPIDTAVMLADGTELNGPGDLRNALVARSDAFVETATEKLLTYALGRAVEYHDMPTIRSIVRAAAQDDYKFSDLVLGIVRSDAFRMRVKGGGE